MNEVMRASYANLSDRFKFNKYVGRGFAAEDMERMEEDLTTLLMDVCRKPAQYDYWLEFVSLDKLTPTEEFEDITNVSSMPEVDITKSDFVRYRYTMIYHGPDGDVILTRSQYLPAIDWRDSSIRVSGIKNYLMPVLTDPKLAPKPTGIGLFSKLYKNKSSIVSKGHLYVVDGTRRLKTFIVFENFYTLNRLENKIDKTLKHLVPPLIGFMLVTYDITTLLKKYASSNYGMDFEIIKGKFKREEGYRYIESTHTQHPDISVPYPERHTYAIKIKDDSPRFLWELGYALIYMFDADVDKANRVYDSIGTKYEINAWRLLLGKVAFKNAFDDAYTIETLGEHMRKVNTYIDTLISRDLAEIGIHATNIYEYIVEIIRVYPEMVKKGQNYYLVVREKRLEVLYYVLYGLISRINTTIDDINRKIFYSKDFSLRHVEHILKKAFKSKEMFNISKGGQQILPLMHYNTTRDNRIYGITSMLEVQERGNGPYKPIRRKGSGSAFPPTLRHLAAVDAYRGTVNYLYKGAPSPRLRFNPTGVWENGNLVYTPELIAELDRLDELLNSYRSDGINEELLEMLEETTHQELDDDI